MTFSYQLCKMFSMGIINFQIHPQLIADSQPLLTWQGCHLRLHNNATIPWLIIIPVTQLIEFHDLPAALQLKITHISQVTSSYFKTELGVEKINFAAIGNLVQQLHIHVIGRHHQDPLWPGVVWGHQLPEKKYSIDVVKTIKNSLTTLLEHSA